MVSPLRLAPCRLTFEKIYGMSPSSASGLGIGTITTCTLSLPSFWGGFEAPLIKNFLKTISHFGVGDE